MEKLLKNKVYKDPIHGYINISYKVIKDLIETKEVQRLKRIHQLGGTLQVFPTAEHSRFSHSLGCYETCRKMIENVQGLKKSLTEKEVVGVLCAALLHDVGHGPFSHAFEMVHGVEHEEYSSSIIRSDSEVSDVLRKYDLNEMVAKIIDKTYSNKLLVQLVSSQLDADRIDYLIRDAYFTGTTFSYIDLDRLIQVMVAKDDKIVFKEAGIANIENFMLGRYHMYKQVYYHPASLCYEVLITNLLKRYFELYQSGYHFKNNYHYLNPFIKNIKVSNDDYYNLDDFVLQFYAKQFMEEDDEIIKDLAYRFINRKLLKRVYAKKDELDLYLSKVKEANLDERYYYFSTLPSQHVYKKYGNKNSASIYVLTRSNEIKELTKISKVVNALSKDEITNSDDYVVIYG